MERIGWEYDLRWFGEIGTCNPSVFAKWSFWPLVFSILDPSVEAQAIFRRALRPIFLRASLLPEGKLRRAKKKVTPSPLKSLVKSHFGKFTLFSVRCSEVNALMPKKFLQDPLVRTNAMSTVDQPSLSLAIGKFFPNPNPNPRCYLAFNGHRSPSGMKMVWKCETKWSALSCSPCAIFLRTPTRATGWWIFLEVTFLHSLFLFSFLFIFFLPRFFFRHIHYGPSLSSRRSEDFYVWARQGWCSVTARVHWSVKHVNF